MLRFSFVLLQGVDPGAAGKGRPVGDGVVEDAVLAAEAVGGAGAGPDHDPAHVAAFRPGEQGPGQPAPPRPHALDARLAHFGVDDVGYDPLPAGFQRQTEAEPCGRQS